MTTAWAKADQAISACIAARPTEYDSATTTTMAKLVAFLKETGRPAPDVGPGYWPTFLVTWSAPGAENLQLEVFGGHIEVYRFDTRLFDLWDENAAPGDPFSEAFIQELPPGAG